VKVDVIEGSDAIVSEGLQEGEKVVIEGQSQLRPGAKVSVRSAKAGDADPKTPKGGGAHGAGPAGPGAGRGPGSGPQP